LLALIPGADTALVTRSALSLGLRGARWTIVGICTGCLIHATASALGLSAILATSARAYETVKLVGAAYLVWIGVQGIWNTRGAVSADPSTALGMTTDGHPERAKRVEGAALALTMRGGHPFTQGFLTNILNPKVALF